MKALSVHPDNGVAIDVVTRALLSTDKKRASIAAEIVDSSDNSTKLRKRAEDIKAQILYVHLNDASRGNILDKFPYFDDSEQSRRDWIDTTKNSLACLLKDRYTSLSQSPLDKVYLFVWTDSQSYGCNLRLASVFGVTLQGEVELLGVYKVRPKIVVSIRSVRGTFSLFRGYSDLKWRGVRDIIFCTVSERGSESDIKLLFPHCQISSVEYLLHHPKKFRYSALIKETTFRTEMKRLFESSCLCDAERVLDNIITSNRDKYPISTAHLEKHRGELLACVGYPVPIRSLLLSHAFKLRELVIRADRNRFAELVFEKGLSQIDYCFDAARLENDWSDLTIRSRESLAELSSLYRDRIRASKVADDCILRLEYSRTDEQERNGFWHRSKSTIVDRGY